MGNQSKKDYYAVLGILPTAEAVVIAGAYRELAKKYHPDKWRGDRSVGEARMRELNEAYEQLSSELRRKEYDRNRAKESTYDSAESPAEQAQRTAKPARSQAPPVTPPSREELMKKGAIAAGLIVFIVIRRVLVGAVAIALVLTIGVMIFMGVTGR